MPNKSSLYYFNSAHGPSVIDRKVVRVVEVDLDSLQNSMRNLDESCSISFFPKPFIFVFELLNEAPKEKENR